MERTKRIEEFIIQSNAIEGVGEEGTLDSLKALDYAMSLKSINEYNLLKIHKILMSGLYPRIAGKFRKCMVMVGGRICPKPDKVKTLLEEVYWQLNNISTERDNKEKNLYAKNAHILFEQAHPFEDGNGRVGRILYNWHRIHLGLPLAVIKYDKRDKYYEWFKDLD